MTSAILRDALEHDSNDTDEPKTILEIGVSNKASTRSSVQPSIAQLAKSHNTSSITTLIASNGAKIVQNTVVIHNPSTPHHQLSHHIHHHHGHPSQQHHYISGNNGGGIHHRPWPPEPELVPPPYQMGYQNSVISNNNNNNGPSNGNPSGGGGAATATTTPLHKNEHKVVRVANETWKERSIQHERGKKKNIIKLNYCLIHRRIVARVEIIKYLVRTQIRDSKLLVQVFLFTFL